MKINKDNFNIILCSTESGSDSYIDVFDTIHCSIDSVTKFRIAILYSLFSEEPIDSITLKGRIIYLGSDSNKKMMYQEIMEEKLYLDSTVCKSAKLKPTLVKSMEFQTPEGIECGYGGVFNIDYSVSFPYYGLYQIELYYYKNEEEEDIFAGAVPLTVCKKQMNEVQ